jgi:ubiquinone/menaquinone biosynthesis C-methylase UbiE
MTNGMTIEKAKLYEAHRLPYAPEAVEDLLAHIGQVQVVADVGAGTGQLARLFAGRCSTLYAVEPDPAMRQVAQASLAAFPTIKIVSGSAEETTLAANSVDLIVIGNAFHRFRPEACAELRRILKETGWMALFAYRFTNQAFAEMLFSKLAALSTMRGKMEKSWHRTPVEALFGAAHIRTYRYPQSHTEEWADFFGAACAGIEAPEPDDSEFAPFEALNREVFDTFAVNGKIRIDYETEASFGRP